MFIIPRLPKTQEEEYKVYPWALSLCFLVHHKRAIAPDFYPVPCMHQTTSTSWHRACRHPSHGRTNKTSCPSPCHESTFLFPCCLSTYQGCLCSWSTLYSCATYNSTSYRNWCLLATKMFLDSLTPTIVPTEATTLLVSFISSPRASSQHYTCAPPNSLP